jgi:ring-1,2-phenylacetyl-CoA epoxidase subunit PaaE
MTPRFHSLQIKEIRKETEDCVSISFEVPDELKNDYSFKSGQYLTLRKTIEGQDTRRSYSLCSAPFEKEWRVAVKKVEQGVFSTFANESLREGETLEVMTPTGNFLYEADAKMTKNIVLFASGSGITPVFSIAKTILHEEPDSSVTLFYGNKNFNSIIFREELEALKNLEMDRFRIIHVLSRESLGNDIQKGRIIKSKADDLFRAFLKDEAIDAVYICGPEEMILGVKESMLANGLASEKVHFELFTTPGQAKEKKSAPSNEPSITANVSVILDGDRLDIALDSSGETILDAAQRAGADLPYACKGGVCCTCKAKLLEGTARMDVNYALEKDEVEAGFILTCQAHPTSERVVVSFDE